ncbi:queuosine salvage family protein [Nocardioides sp. cx-169]|uniref:queuosine salvage family protein n=1 Tax=Nocardioides sp. cx-169 TaxID=2899080 RepID=UPI001E430C3D|nr:queuosine salvage family protein [Nocardioides sp. cx-169]MCD4533532.1 queuosine salvage family protein [Nocardioides sp. cx-169]
MTSNAWKASVLASCATASPLCRDVTIDDEQVSAVADWMCFEVFAPIGGAQPDPERPFLTDPDDQIDFALVTTAINFAYTDFETGVPWSVEHEGRELVDADGMFLRFEQALAAGVPVLEGAWLASVTEEQLAEVLHGPRPIPLLGERVRVLNEIGAVLVERYDGRFSTFVADCPPRAYADGAGLLERLTSEFAQFDDSSIVHGVPVRIDKLAQLGVWTLHRLGLVLLEDLDSLAVFADYIVPAALRALRVLRYSPALAAAVDDGRIVPSGSDWENEIRVQTIVACARITDALNERRAEPVVNAQVDYRFWSAFHDLIRPHHLTVTTRY